MNQNNKLLTDMKTMKPTNNQIRPLLNPDNQLQGKSNINLFDPKEKQVDQIDLIQQQHR